MSLNSQKFSLLAAGASGALYAACAFFVTLFPDLSAKLMGWLFHLTNPEAVFGDQRVTLTGFTGGLAEVVIYMYIAALLFTWVFNKSTK